MDRVRRQIGYHYAFKQGLTGRGIGVGVLDSGAMRHPDYIKNIREFKDFIYGKNQLYDDINHGSFVCGVIAGNGRMSNGLYRGLASNVELYVGKILDHNGDGDYNQLANGLEWLLDNRERFHLRIINISVGTKKHKSSDPMLEKEERIQALIKRAYRENVLVVTAAGNFGPDPYSISAIGEGRHAICVGCHDGNFRPRNTKMCDEISGRGPSRYDIRKPDIVAPGTAIVSCGPGGYIRKSGTSMACPIVTGAIALAMEKYPEVSVQDIMKKLVYSATDLREPWPKQGWGMINIRDLLY